MKRPATPANELLALLQEQRGLLLRSDPAALAELEFGTNRIEQALAQLAELARQPRSRPADPADAVLLARLRDELQANRSMLTTLAAANRRALHALFGEPPLYGK